MEPLLYLAAIIVIVAIGFVFAMWLSIKGIRDSEHDWEAKAAAADHEDAEAVATAGAHAAH